MKKILLSALACLSFACCFGQEQPSFDKRVYVEALTTPGATSVQSIDERYRGIEGTPYYVKEWSQGEIITPAGKQYDDVPLKFDVYSRLLILKRAEGDSIIVNDHQVAQFKLWIDGTEHHFKKIAASPGVVGEYYLVLYEGKSSLLVKLTKELQKADYQGAYSPDQRTDKFIDKKEFFVKTADSEIRPVKLNNKAVLQALKDKQQEVERFISKEKIKIKSEASLIRVLAFYDSI